jgi:hypothetical protein
MNKNLSDKIDALKQSIVDKEKATLDNTPIQQLLPLVFEDRRSIPNAFIRSALFGMVKKGARQEMKNCEIFSFEQYKIRYSGEALDQTDLMTWDTIVYLAKILQSNELLSTSKYKILQELGLTQTGTNSKAVFNRLKRLQGGQIEIEIKSNNKKRAKGWYVGSLLDDVFVNEETGEVQIRFNKKLLTIFGQKKESSNLLEGDFSIVKHHERLLIGESQLSRWLYHLYSSSNNIYPLSMEFLKELSRSNLSIIEFRRYIKASMNDICYKLGWTYKIEDDKLTVLTK